MADTVSYRFWQDTGADPDGVGVPLVPIAPTTILSDASDATQVTGGTDAPGNNPTSTVILEVVHAFDALMAVSAFSFRALAYNSTGGGGGGLISANAYALDFWNGSTWGALSAGVLPLVVLPAAQTPTTIAAAVGPQNTTMVRLRLSVHRQISRNMTLHCYESTLTTALVPSQVAISAALSLDISQLAGIFGVVPISVNCPLDIAAVSAIVERNYVPWDRDCDSEDAAWGRQN